MFINHVQMLQVDHGLTKRVRLDHLSHVLHFFMVFLNMLDNIFWLRHKCCLSSVIVSLVFWVKCCMNYFSSFVQRRWLEFRSTEIFASHSRRADHLINGRWLYSFMCHSRHVNGLSESLRCRVDT